MLLYKTFPKVRIAQQASAHIWSHSYKIKSATWQINKQWFIFCQSTTQLICTLGNLGTEQSLSSKIAKHLNQFQVLKFASKLNIFRLWLKQDIWWHLIGHEEIMMGILCFLIVCNETINYFNSNLYFRLTRVHSNTLKKQNKQTIWHTR